MANITVSGKQKLSFVKNASCWIWITTFTFRA